MIIFGGGQRGGCGVFGCLPLLVIALLISVAVLVLSGGHVFFFAI